MAQSNRSPQDIVNDIYTHVIDPLRGFRKNVSPLNSNQIDGVSDFARIIDGLLTGSDGELAWQGPASDALANLIGQYLDKEQKLTGYDDTMLQGRLQDASHLCEKYANDIETNFIPNIRGKPGAHGSSTSTFLLQPLADGPGEDEPQEGDPEDVTETEIDFQGEQFQGDMKWGPERESLQELTQLPPFESTLPPDDNPLNENLPADDPQTSTLGLTPEQEQMAETFANNSGIPLDQMREIVQEEYRAHPNWTADQHEANISNFTQSLTPEEQEEISARGLSYSDVFTIKDEHSGLSNNSAIEALTGSPGATPQVGGARAQGADVRFVDSNGNVVLEDVKVFQAGSSDTSFKKAIKSATDQTGGTGVIFMQAGDPNQARAYLNQFRNGALGQDQARFGNMRIIIVDTNGNVIINEPLIPKSNP